MVLCEQERHGFDAVFFALWGFTPDTFGNPTTSPAPETAAWSSALLVELPEFSTQNFGDYAPFKTIFDSAGRDNMALTVQFQNVVGKYLPFGVPKAPESGSTGQELFDIQQICLCAAKSLGDSLNSMQERETPQIMGCSLASGGSQSPETPTKGLDNSDDGGGESYEAYHTPLGPPSIRIREPLNTDYQHCHSKDRPDLSQHISLLSLSQLLLASVAITAIISFMLGKSHSPYI